jgi:hypothetical protein
LIRRKKEEGGDDRGSIAVFSLLIYAVQRAAMAKLEFYSSSRNVSAASPP